MAFLETQKSKMSLAPIENPLRSKLETDLREKICLAVANEQKKYEHLKHSGKEGDYLKYCKKIEKAYNKTINEERQKIFPLLYQIADATRELKDLQSKVAKTMHEIKVLSEVQKQLQEWANFWIHYSMSYKDRIEKIKEKPNSLFTQLLLKLLEENPPTYDDTLWNYEREPLKPEYYVRIIELVVAKLQKKELKLSNMLTDDIPNCRSKFVALNESRDDPQILGLFLLEYEKRYGDSPVLIENSYNSKLEALKKLNQFSIELLKTTKYKVAQHFTRLRASLKRISDSLVFRIKPENVRVPLRDVSLHQMQIRARKVKAGEQPFMKSTEEAVSIYYEELLRSIGETKVIVGDYFSGEEIFDSSFCEEFFQESKELEELENNLHTIRTSISEVRKEWAKTGTEMFVQNDMLSTLEREERAAAEALGAFQVKLFRNYGEIEIYSPMSLALHKLRSSFGKTYMHESILAGYQHMISKLEQFSESEEARTNSKYFTQLVDGIEQLKQVEDKTAYYAAVSLYQQFSYKMNGALIRSFEDDQTREQIWQAKCKLSKHGLPVEFRRKVCKTYMELIEMRMKNERKVRGEDIIFPSDYSDIAKNQDLWMKAFITSLSENPHLYAAVLMQAHGDNIFMYRTEDIVVYHALATPQAAAVMLGIAPNLEDGSNPLEDMVKRRTENIRNAQREANSQEAIMHAKNESAIEMCNFLKSRFGIAFGAKSTSKAFLSASTSLEVVQNSSYSDCGIILEVIVDKDIPGLPICVPSSLIAEGEIQFGKGGSLVFHSARVVDGNVHVVATLRPESDYDRPRGEVKRHTVIDGEMETYDVIDVSQLPAHYTEDCNKLYVETAERSQRLRKGRSEAEAQPTGAIPSPGADAGAALDLGAVPLKPSADSPLVPA
jgi:hypothetical protein